MLILNSIKKQFKYEIGDPISSKFEIKETKRSQELLDVIRAAIENQRLNSLKIIGLNSPNSFIGEITWKQAIETVENLASNYESNTNNEKEIIFKLKRDYNLNID